jgi:murein L,D-transpeptidase YafK
MSYTVAFRSSGGALHSWRNHRRNLMLLPLLGAALLLSTPPTDTATSMSTIVRPTIVHAPAVGIKGQIIADSIVVEKMKHTLTLFASGLPMRTYLVALGKQPKGDKIAIGDGRTPEGVFHIDFRNAQSRYHKSLHISYPDAAHVERANSVGSSPGGDIMIHGLPPAYASMGAAHRRVDWTEGCIAVTDAEIEEIWRAVPDGALIHIKP